MLSNYSRIRFIPPLKTSLRVRCCSNSPGVNANTQNCETNKTFVRAFEQDYSTDQWTNVTPKILGFLNKNIYLEKHHPLSLIRERIVDFFYKYKTRRGNPVFSVFDQLNPVVTLEQNYDSLLVPKDHPSRKKSDSYYLNSQYMLRAHTSAHQTELIGMGLDNFIMVGDVYRRDEIDRNHYPVFHQMDGVNILNEMDIRSLVQVNDNSKMVEFDVFEPETSEQRTSYKQEKHTVETTKLLEKDLKDCLLKLTQTLFGNDIEYRWVDAYFPFTHPSWELEIMYQGKWLEVLGCGIMEQKILHNCGVDRKAGWAFGLGLERLAMKLFQIPDIRLFWSSDSGFKNQFITNDLKKKIIFRPISKYPQCTNDISFWLPDDVDSYTPNDFYDLVREVGGDVVEQVSLVDEFRHPKTQKMSHCYRIVYRSMDRTLEQSEVNQIHSEIEGRVAQSFKVTIR